MTEQELQVSREEVLIKVRNDMARFCMRVAHDSRFTREAQTAALRVAKGLVPDPDEEDNEVTS